MSFRHTFTAISSLLLALPTSIAAQQTATDLTPVTTVEGISEYRLENGLRVLLFPDVSKPQTTVAITYMVGSRHEGYGENNPFGILLERTLSAAYLWHNYANSTIG